MSSSGARSYHVFISYSHADNRDEGRRWANWLHESLESYEVPTSLIGKPGPDGAPIPDALFPVFRDEDEMAANADLSATIRSALERSTWLVVICSPRSAQSIYVNAEVRTFKELGKGHRILALIVDGSPNAGDARECLPLALRTGVVKPDGDIDWNAPSEPICADTRPDGHDGQGYTTPAYYRASIAALSNVSTRELRDKTREYRKRLDVARMKIIAGLLGVSLGDLTRADNKFRLQRLRRALIVVGTLAIAAILAAIVAVIEQRHAERQRVAADHANQQANTLINEMLYGLGGKLKPLGQLKLLDNVSLAAQQYFTEIPADRESPELALQRAVMWINRGNVIEAQGDDDAAEICFRNAQQELAQLGGTHAEGPAQARRYYSLNLERIADVLEDEDPKNALASTQQAIIMHQQLLREQPKGLPLEQLNQELAQIYERLGDILEDSAADLDAAGDAFAKSRAIRRALIPEGKDKPIVPEFARDYGVACARVGDVRKAMGDYKAALEAYEEGLRVRKDLVAKHGLNAGWISEISRSHSSVAEIAEALGDDARAQAEHEEALRLRTTLSEFDPTDKKVQGDYTRSCLAVARLQSKRQGRASGAMLYAKAKTALEERLAKKLDIKTGLDLASALRMAAQWDRSEGTLDHAIAQLGIAREWIGKLRAVVKVKAADNSKLDRMEALLLADAGECLAEQKQPTKALASLEAAVSLMHPLIAHNQDNNELLAELAWMEGRAGQLGSKPDVTAKSVAILQKLAADQRLSVDGQGWLRLLTNSNP